MANEGSNVWPPRVGSQRHAPEPEHGSAQSLIEDHAADDLAEACAGVFLSHQQTFGTTPTACIRFAILSRIETLHILLEHFYDSQRNENAAQVADFIGGSPVARSQDLNQATSAHSIGPSRERWPAGSAPTFLKEPEKRTQDCHGDEKGQPAPAE
jgi:hypothetical protein